MSHRFRFILLPLLLAPSVAQSQTRTTLAAGQVVRVATRCQIASRANSSCPLPGTPSSTEWTYSGTLEAVSADTLYVRVQWKDPAFAIPTNSIVAAAYRTQRGHTLRGAGIGLLGGVVVGAAIASAVGFEGSYLFEDSDPLLVGALLGAPPGLLIGSIVGALIRSDRWLPLSVADHRISVAPRLDARGVAVSVTIREEL